MESLSSSSSSLELACFSLLLLAGGEEEEEGEYDGGEAVPKEEDAEAKVSFFTSHPLLFPGDGVTR